MSQTDAQQLSTDSYLRAKQSNKFLIMSSQDIFKHDNANESLKRVKQKKFMNLRFELLSMFFCY